MTQDIETIGIADLFAPLSPARDRTDARIMAAAFGHRLPEWSKFAVGLWKAAGLLALAEAISGRPDGESAIVGCDMKVGVSAERADESRCF
jgi:hypothetical protein